jgi:sarcosine oxidase subunit beta
LEQAVPDIVIVGGGITGAATAYWLAVEGYEVELIEAHRIAAMGSGWSLGGVRQSGRDPAELPLARAAVALWPELAARLGGETEYRQRGNVRLARTPAEIEVIRTLVADQRALGLNLTFLPDNKSVREVAPALSEQVLAASLCPTDGHANPALTTETFAAAARRHGATIREGVSVTRVVAEAGRVTGVETSHGFVPAGTVVLAGGIHTPELLTPLGLTLPLTVTCVNVLQTAPLPPCFEQVFGVANADCAGRQQADGRLRVTSGIGRWPGNPTEWHRVDLRPDEAVTARMTDLIAQVLPVLQSVPLERAYRSDARWAAGHRSAG